jgi:FkbM family methyltransferase
MIQIWRRLKSETHPARLIVSRLLMLLGLSHFITIRRKDYLLRFFPTAFSASLWADPKAWEEDEAFFRSYLEAGDHVIDVGANIGSLSLVAARAVGPSGRVYTIEAHPRTFRFLEGNIALNRAQNVTAFHTALGQKEGTIHFSSRRSDDQNAVIESGEGIDVPITLLDRLDIPSSTIALLKIDVEGYEKYVLEGASQTLGRTLCVYFEAWEDHFAKYRYTNRDVLRLLAAQGFALFKITGPRQMRSISEDYLSQQCDNLLALRQPEDFLRRTGFEIEPISTGDL